MSQRDSGYQRKAFDAYDHLAGSLSACCHTSTVFNRSGSNVPLLSGGIAQHALVVLLHRFDSQRGLRKAGLGVVESDLELLGIKSIY
jgi:hypothetical protein